MSAQVLDAAGPSVPVSIRGNGNMPLQLPTSIFCIVSDEGTLTYNIEVSPDANEPRDWLPVDAGSAGLTASKIGTLDFAVRAVRANVTQLTNGTLTFKVCS